MRYFCMVYRNIRMLTVHLNQFKTYHCFSAPIIARGSVTMFCSYLQTEKQMDLTAGYRQNICGSKTVVPKSHRADLIASWNNGAIARPQP